MASSSDNISMAVFCDFENVALGVRDANYEKFDIKPVLERLLLKGSIVVKKAYCDWDRYKGFKSTMHEANFELIEIPHVRQSGKNSADIRLVVDALDLCYTKSHVNTFVIISGDSDFSPLVSKLRENAKQVIGVGVKQSTSDLLVANCDEFIFYDDLVREVRRAAAKRDEKKSQQNQPAARRTPDEKSGRKEEAEARKTQALELVVEMFDALVTERGDSGKIWASLLKDTLKRRRPDFNETYYGFRTFGNLLEEAQSRGLLEFGRDEKSGAYVYRSAGLQTAHVPATEQELAAQVEEITSDLPQAAVEQEEAERERPPKESRRRGRGGRKQREEAAAEAPAAQAVDVAAAEQVPEPLEADQAEAPAMEAADATPAVEPANAPVNAPEPAAADAASAAAPAEKRRTPRAPRKAAAKKAAPKAAELPLEDTIEQAIAEPAPVVEPAAEVAPVEPDLQAPVVLEGADEALGGDNPAQAEASDAQAADAAPKRKPIPRGRRPVKPKAPKKPA